MRPSVPRQARDILNRINEITSNSALMPELRAIDHIARLAGAGKLKASDDREVRLHMIEARDRMYPLGVSSKLNTEWAFLRHLFDIGREPATAWLSKP